MRIFNTFVLIAGMSLFTLSCGDGNKNTPSSGIGSGGWGSGPSASVWITEILDSTVSENQEGQTSITVDSSNNLHISYHGSLKYVSNVSDGWGIPETLTAGDAGYYNSILTDSGGNVHIVYWNEETEELLHVTNESGPWVPSVIDDTDGGKFASVAVDSDDVLHVIYWAHITAGGLKYVTKNPSDPWDTSETVEAAIDIGVGTSIAIDSDDNVHISYYDDTNRTLKYATNMSGLWVITPINSSGVTGMYNSIVIDSDDNVHISYYDDTNGDLMYVRNMSNIWFVREVDSSGVTGMHNSIAVDSNDNIHISYHNATSGRLKYATNRSGSWITSNIDLSDNGLTDIIIDSGDRPFISYYDVSGLLKYAHK